MRKLKRASSLVEQASDAIRELIVGGELRMGARVSEGRLAEALGISTTPVREALALLQQEGLLTIVPQKGTYVFTLAAGEFDQLCELRAALEPAAVQIALERAPQRLADVLCGIVARMDQALERGDIKGYLKLDTAFHQAFFDACGNPYLQRAHALIAGKMAALRNRLGADPHHVEKSMREHREMAAGFALGGEAAAAALVILHRHIAKREGSYWEHLERDLASLLPPAPVGGGEPRRLAS